VERVCAVGDEIFIEIFISIFVFICFEFIEFEFTVRLSYFSYFQLSLQGEFIRRVSLTQFKMFEKIEG
jgi:hypothetical protein